MSNDKREKTLLDEARELAASYNKRATEFSERIKKFQSWLQRLEFRAGAMVDFSSGPRNYRLFFANRPSKWGLYVSCKKVGRWEPVGDLETCSIEIKVAAATAFPELLENLLAAQREALAKIDAAHTVMDDMAENIGHFEKEGE